MMTMTTTTMTTAVILAPVPFTLRLFQESREACNAMGGDLAQPSTPEEQDKMLAAIRKFPTSKSDSYNEITCYWIGLKKAADAFWVSGEELALDSGLNLINANQCDNKGNKDICGAIHSKGIEDHRCDYALKGFVCEFDYASPICVQRKEITGLVLEPNTE